jgi:hypothetical protein
VPGQEGARRRTGPIWLLDVDGVLNAVTVEPDRTAWPQWTTGTAYTSGRGYPITFSPAVTGVIRDLHDRGLVEVRWLTTWAQDANRDLRRLLDLPEFPVVGRPGGSAVWWKLPYAQEVGREGRPLIWTDDELGYSAEAMDWLNGLEQPALAIAPHPAVGLRREHLDKVSGFLTDHGSTPEP